MNLYNFHSKPKLLAHYETKDETNPHIFWEKYKNNREELKKREKYIAKDAAYAYWYAQYVVNGPFPLGEAAIAADAQYAYRYAKDVLEGPFPLGEEAISKDAEFAVYYAKYVLKADFYFNGKLIAKAK